MSEATILDRSEIAAEELRGDSLYEVVGGVAVEKPPMSAMEVWVASELAAHLRAFVVAGGLGRVFIEMLFQLGPDLPRRRPDAAFVSAGRWPAARLIPSDEALDVVPDLAIEVVSRSNAAPDVEKKLREYFRAGVRRVWLIYPTERSAYDYDGPKSVRRLVEGDALEGGELLPGYRLALAELFEQIETSE